MQKIFRAPTVISTYSSRPLSRPNIGIRAGSWLAARIAQLLWGQVPNKYLGIMGFFIVLCLLPTSNPPLNTLQAIHQNGSLIIGVDSLNLTIAPEAKHPSNISLKMLKLLAHELEVGLQIREINQYHYSHNPWPPVDALLILEQHGQQNQDQNQDNSAHPTDAPPLTTQLSDPLLVFDAKSFDFLSTTTIENQTENQKAPNETLLNAVNIRLAMNPLKDPGLLQLINDFSSTFQQSDNYKYLQSRFLQPSTKIAPIEKHFFILRVERLQALLPHLKNHATQQDLDWGLLAAMAYQESHWDPLATSPTGVRGVMMVTNAVAKEVGIVDRLDPEQSIQGGAVYFRHLKDRLPSFISEPDRTWMTLAAYNLGFSTIRNAILQTQREQQDATDWFIVRKHLATFEKNIPVVNSTKYVKGAKQGKQYVQKVRQFHSVIQKSKAFKIALEQKAPQQLALKESLSANNDRPKDYSDF